MMLESCCLLLFRGAHRCYARCALGPACCHHGEGKGNRINLNLCFLKKECFFFFLKKYILKHKNTYIVSYVFALFLSSSKNFMLLLRRITSNHTQLTRQCSFPTRNIKKCIFLATRGRECNWLNKPRGRKKTNRKLIGFCTLLTLLTKSCRWKLHIKHLLKFTYWA